MTENSARAGRFLCSSRLLTLVSAMALTLECSGPVAEGQELQPRYPLAVAVASDGTLYLADRLLPGIWKVSEGTVSLHFQASRANRSPLNAIRCLGIDHEGNLLAGDSATREIYRLSGTEAPQPLTAGRIGLPVSIVVDRQGAIWVADLETHAVMKVPSAGGEPSVVTQLPAPRGLAFDREDRLWIVSHGENQLLRLAADARAPEVIVSGQPFQFPHQVALDDAGTAYVSDGYARAIWKVVPGSAPVKLVAGPPLENPVGLVVVSGHLVVVDPRANSLFDVSFAGAIERTLTLGTPLKTSRP